MLPFPQAVQQLVRAVEEAAPERVTLELEDVSLAELAWAARDGKTPAKRLIVWAPSGACRAFGLLPRRGRYRSAPGPDGYPPSVAGISPQLVITHAPPPEVALDFAAMERARPLLEQACAPIARWGEGKPVPPAERPEAFRAAKRVVRHAHYLEVDLPAGAKLDLPAVSAWGFDAVAYRELPESGPPPGPSIAIKAPPKD